jgi:ribosome biogenesis GTPase / thiamine phosphate phosphatase
MTEELLIGTVTRAVGGGLYEVDIEGDDDPSPRVCQIRGILKKGPQKTTQPVVVGDRVTVRERENTGANVRGDYLREGFIEEVLPRRSTLSRGRIGKTSQITLANLDQVVIVMAVREPDLNTHRLDRFLVLAESNELKALICFNKIDLLKKREIKKEIEPVKALYESLGYPCVLTAADEDVGVPQVQEYLKGHISAVLGSSGVGKSSLVNAVQPGLHLWVGDVMDIGKGRHTTTDVSLHPLDFGGYIADTPGVKTVVLFEQHDVVLDQCFPEFRPFIDDCRFNNCTHDHEPKCAIRAAVDDKKIAPARYESYVKMLRDVQQAKKIWE